MYFEYTDDCIIGIPQIDAEHKYLFNLMNQLMESLQKKGSVNGKGLEDYVELLIHYGEEHFAHEEAYLESTKDIELARQKHDHTLFLQKMRALDIMDLDDGEKYALLKDTLAYLTKWLYNHILGSDTLIGKVEHIAEHVMDEDDFCKFTEKYMIGVEQIDNEHRGLFDIIGRAYRLVESEGAVNRYDDIMGLLDDLVDYTQVHFTHEEEYMKQISYPYLSAQQRAHGTFLDRLSERDLGENEDNQQEYLEELLDFLYAWLGNHILKMDKKIGQYSGGK